MAATELVECTLERALVLPALEARGYREGRRASLLTYTVSPAGLIRWREAKEADDVDASQQQQLPLPLPGMRQACAADRSLGR